MEQRIFIFKLGLSACGLSTIVLALPAMGAFAMGLPLLAGITLALVGLCGLLMSFSLKFDALGVRALVVIVISILVFATELALTWGRSL